MTDEPPLNESSPADPPDDQTPATVDAVESAATDEGDELPEWEPLTPEDVEDEALRGDFMLRCATVLLAFLFGCTWLTETETLVAIRSGQWMADHSLLPPATDVFSTSAADRSWVNLHWLTDLGLGIVQPVAGFGGLTLVKALLAGIAFWFVVHTSRKGVSTWWGSLMAVTALVALFPVLTLTPTLLTALLLALLMWLWQRAMETGKTVYLWLLIPLFVYWANHDGRMFIGATVLVLSAVGVSIGRKPETAVGLTLGKVWLATGLSLLATLANPFTWRAIAAPLSLYRIEYPALRNYITSDTAFPQLVLPLWDVRVWQPLQPFVVVSLLLMVAAAICLVLNARRVRFDHLLVFVGINALAVFAGTELALAGIVNAIVATLNAQQWYIDHCRQEYTVNTGELVFSRGGRALTVLGFFGLAYLVISGWLSPAGGRRVGLGLSPPLAATIKSYEEVLDDGFDDRPFNFRPDQGDLLIWLKQRPYIDNRMQLFGAGEPSIVDQHLQLRWSLLSAAPQRPVDAGNPRIWQPVFRELEITHVLPRLSGANPDYMSYFDLLANPLWAMTRQGAATAPFYWIDSNNKALSDYLDQHQGLEFVQQAFQSGDQQIADRSVGPTAPSFYETHIFPPVQRQSTDIQIASHYDSLLQAGLGAKRPGQALALAMLAIRHAQQGLADEPNNAAGYRVLGNCYQILNRVENQLQPLPPRAARNDMRYFQSLAAYHQASVCDPSDPLPHMSLVDLYLQAGRGDLALVHLKRFRELTGRLTLRSPDDPLYAAEVEQRLQLMDTLTTQLEQLTTTVDESLDQGRELVDVASQTAQAGAVLKALDVLETDLTETAGDPMATLLRGRLLLEAGRLDEAYDVLEGGLEIAGGQADRGVAMLVANANLALGRHLRAAELLGPPAEQIALQRASLLTSTAPFAAQPAVPGQHPFVVWPASRYVVYRTAYDQLGTQWSDLILMRALIELERGQNTLAKRLLESILQDDPGAFLRPTIALYLTLLSGESILPVPPATDEPDKALQELPESS